MSAVVAAPAAAAAAPKKEEEAKSPPIAVLSQEELENKFQSLKPILYRGGPFCPAAAFTPGWETLELLTKNTRILVVGAGGLGCELLKDLALSGFSDITVIDMDTIDVTNLNRQFLFRKKDVSQGKAKVAAEFIMRRCKGVKVQYRTKKLQEFGAKFYESFHVVIAGLDNVEARSWLNEMLCDLVRYDESGEVDWDTVIPMIDGGTTGFMGQSRLFVPKYSSCFECQTHTLQAGDHVHAHLCTIADVPRIPEHCIQYALILLWPKLLSLNSPEDFKMAEKPKDWDEKKEWEPPSAVKLDKDDPLHMTWIFRRAEERATKYNIKGVTYLLTQQVVKNIIPAIASTNALISASCVTEALKYRTFCAYRLNNYMMYMGDVATNSETFPHAKIPNCKSCSKPVLVDFDEATATIEDLHNAVQQALKLDSPNYIHRGLPIYDTADTNSASKLKIQLSALAIVHNTLLYVFSKGRNEVKVIVRFKGKYKEQK